MSSVFFVIRQISYLQDARGRFSVAYSVFRIPGHCRVTAGSLPGHCRVTALASGFFLKSHKSQQYTGIMSEKENTIRLASIPGDGIGTEVIRSALEYLSPKAASFDVNIDVEELDWGADKWLREGVGIPKGKLERLQKEKHAIFFGAVGDPRIPDMAHGREILLGLRKRLDLYANVRPIQILKPELSPLKNAQNIDMVIIRENTEGIYVGEGTHESEGTINERACDISVNTYMGVERIIRYAFELAKKRRGHVTLVDKNNAMRFGGSLWQRTFKEVAGDFANVETAHLYADVACMRLVDDPQRFDVIVTDNLFGDILSDIGASIMGSLGLAASANINPGKLSLFEPVHGSAPDIVGQGIANPLAAVMTGAMLFDELGYLELATSIRKDAMGAVRKGLVTPDLGGELKTEAVIEELVSHI